MTINRSAGAPASTTTSPGREMQILGIGREPLELILLEIFENGNLAESLN